MVIDFSTIDLRHRPNFILRNLDGKAIGVLGHILSPEADIYCNELSAIRFEYPAQVNGVELDEYDLLTGMRIVDVQGFGQFILHNPVENDDGVVKIKSCTGYSLEYEFQNKSISLEESTYNFWNPLMCDGTILEIILSEMPSWSIGTVSTKLIGKYRTFSVDNISIYDFMKSELQDTYECYFDFDTYNRKINVYSTSELVPVKPIYISTSNIAKEIEIEENLDDLVTVLDVTGADGVDIRSVNPMGSNKIYNLDAYMTEKYFSADMIAKWNNWKSTFDSYQVPYYNLVVAQNMQISRYATEYAVLGDLKGELTSLESKKAALLQAVAMDSSVKSQLDNVNAQIRSKNGEITTQNNLLTTIQNQISSYTLQLKRINQATSFSAFFSDEELLVLDHYFRCGSLSDSSFVASTIDSYSIDSSVMRGFSSIFNLTNLTTLRNVNYTGDITFYTVRGGSIGESSSSLRLNAEIVNGTIQVNTDKTFVASLYLNRGTINGSSFSGGTLSMTGTLRTNIITSDDSLQFATSSATAYMTYEVSEYQRMAIAWDLYEYGKEVLEQKASPTYTFTVDSTNFFALDDFLAFTKEFSLGERIYLHLNKGVLTPIVTGVEMKFDDLSKLVLQFSNEFKIKDEFLEHQDDIAKSDSMGKSLNFNQYNYSSFVSSGANTRVKSFMESALDTMKNRILSGEHEEITVDQAGLRCRKYDESTGGYSPKQIWMAHNALMFTSDNWNSAVIGIGEFVDKNLGSLYGIVTPALVGTILAGNNLIIESEKTDGGIAVFKMDGEGASLHNASFNLYNTNGGRIDMGSVYGIVAGANQNTLFYYNSKGQPTGVRTKNNKSITSIDDLDSNDEPNAAFWLDMDGSAYFKGTILARDGYIGGWTLEEDYLHSGSNNNYVALNASTKTNSLYAIWAGAASPASAPFYVTKSGNIYAKNGTFQGIIQGGTFKDSSGKAMMNANYQFTSGYLNLLGLNVGNGNFVVGSDGSVSVKGNITMAAGSSINWSNVTETNASLSDSYKRANSAYSLANTAYDNANTAYDQAVSAADDAYYALRVAQNNAVTDQKVFDILTGGGTKFGIFSDSTTNRLYINANYIRSGTIDADYITLGSSWGGFCCGMGNDGTNDTYGAKMFGSNSNYYVLATNAGVRMQASSKSFYVTRSGVYSSEEITTTSDKRKKNSIAYDMDKYQDFFMRLKPSYFRYNNGNSGRFHIGFIAQDVEQAIAESNITTQDFAGFVKSAGEGDVHDEYEDQEYLRYSDFISLNTYMIQSLFRRIDSLEKQIKYLKENDNG